MSPNTSEDTVPAKKNDKALTTPFDPEAFQQELADRVKAAFMEAMPASAFEGLVEKSIQKFLSGKTKVKNPEWGRRNEYNRHGIPEFLPGPSEFDTHVHGLLREWMAKQAETFFASEKWLSNQGQYGDHFSEGIRDLLIECAPEMLAGMIQGAAQHAIQKFREEMRQTGGLL